MNRRCRLVIELFLLISGLAGGTSSAAPAIETLARVHWLGLNRIAADTNATSFMSAWRLPQTAALEAQTLDKLSRWPGHGATNAASALLRPLLDDLISSEFYLEISAPTNFPPLTGFRPSTLDPRLSYTIALHLPADRARLWQTNLAAALQTLTGVHPVSTKNGWVLSLKPVSVGTSRRDVPARETAGGRVAPLNAARTAQRAVPAGYSSPLDTLRTNLPPTNSPACIEFSRSGEWTLVGWGPGPNNLLSEFATRIARDEASSTATNFWLEADLNPSAIFSLSARGAGGEGRGEVGPKTISTLNAQLSTLNHFHLTVTGLAGNVLTHGTLDFARPLNLSLPPWEFPTNLIHQPLAGFAAVRGFGPWLGARPAWQKLGLTPPPDQAYVWASQLSLFELCFAAPLPGANNQLRHLADRIVSDANAWLLTNNEGNLLWQTNPPALAWNNAYLIAPNLKPASANGQDYVLGSLVQRTGDDTNPPPAEILSAMFGTPNLVYYETEQTGFRIDDDLYTSQLFRLIFHRPQLPATAGLWLKHLVPIMGGSTTFVTQTGPAQLSLSRSSTIGLTALELHLLADWVESPRFPYGLHTFSTPRE